MTQDAIEKVLAAHAEHFKQLREQTEKALLRAHRRRKRIGGAVNWADLSVVCCELIISDSEQPFYRVTIEEAAPEAYALGEFIQLQLKRAGLEAQVICEW